MLCFVFAVLVLCVIFNIVLFCKTHPPEGFYLFLKLCRGLPRASLCFPVERGPRAPHFPFQRSFVTSHMKFFTFFFSSLSCMTKYCSDLVTRGRGMQGSYDASSRSPFLPLIGLSDPYRCRTSHVSLIPVHPQNQINWF